MIITTVVRITKNKFVLMLKFAEEKTLGINKKIENGFFIPPVK